MSDFERRFLEHMAADEAAIARVNQGIDKIDARLDKFENNHFAHIEPDIRFLKDFAVRSEKLLRDVVDELRQNTKDTQEMKVNMAIKIGEVNTKIAGLEGREGSNSEWGKTLIIMVISALIGAAITYFSK